MKANHYFLLALLLFAASFTYAQNNPPLILRSGPVRVGNNINPSEIDSFNRKALKHKNKTFALLQFETLPTENIKEELFKNGIELLEYVPNNAFTVTITGRVNAGLLQKAKARALVQLTPQQKMHAALITRPLPAWAVKVAGTVDVWMMFPKTFTSDEVLEALKEKGFEVIGTTLIRYRVVGLRVAANRLTELAGYPFVAFVQPENPKEKPLNFHNRWASGAIGLNTAVTDGGRGLNGEGVVLGVGDNADIQDHVDFSGRLINRADAGGEGHGTHVSGIAAGAGIINEQVRGYAPKAKIVSQYFSGILANVPAYVLDYDMVLTNNSYGQVINCDFNGAYDVVSYILDEQAIIFPELQNVFAAGNSGGNTCAPFTSGYGTVLGAFQAAKNVMTVGNADLFGSLSGSSSRGPVKDGRTKPDITAMGSAVLSTFPGNSYAHDWGTSMASPAVTGGMALLYEQYRKLNGGNNPKSGLIKALVCNGGVDKGNAGPDYNYGYGFMNLTRSIAMLDNNQYYTGNVAHNGIQTQTITVPPNTAQLKVMLYWQDPPGTLISGPSLINDLDLEVYNPAMQTILPQILDARPAFVANAAATGVDRVNNMEQVVINNPVAGTYTIRIKGERVILNPTQSYFVVYDPVPVTTQLVYPTGGTALVPGETINISWDAYGDPANTFTLDFSTDNGNTWSNIATALNAQARHHAWTVPGIATNNALIRLQRDGTSMISTSQPFTIIGTPTVTLAPTQCPGYIALNWNTVAGATDYQVMMLRGDEMVPIATTFSNTHTLNSLHQDSIYWISVRARINGKPGRRANAFSRQPNNGTCSGTISDNDLQLSKILAPSIGRRFTTTALTNTTPVTIEIKNLDDAPVNNFTATYSVNGVVQSENVTATIAPGGTYVHTFSVTHDMSAAGNYTIEATVKNSGDNASENDKLTTIVQQLGNEPLDLSIPFVDGMESAAIASYMQEKVGLTGIDRYDFKTASTFGRVRTFVNTGVAGSGQNAITLDKSRSINDPAGNTFIGTYNLSGYNTSINNLRFDFIFNNHGANYFSGNRVWIRGSDTQPWIPVYDMVASTTRYGFYINSGSMSLTDFLNNAGQQFSSSFQIRWDQNGVAQATDISKGGGITIDDVRIYETLNDVRMVSIDAPAAFNCGLNNNVAIKVTINNTAQHAIANVPVRYSINGGAWVEEILPFINAHTQLQYTFTRTADFSVPGARVLRAAVAYALDDYKPNDMQTIIVQSAAVVSSFPYLQNFESNTNGWFSVGTANSWQYGTPAAPKINSAASGTRAWKTNLTGNYNTRELSYLYSPCFNVSGMTNPTISFNKALDIENCTPACDGAWVEYSINNQPWVKLDDTNSSGTNWYGNGVWQVRDYTRWHVATMALPAGNHSVQIRFVFQSDAFTTAEGIAIDDIHVYDNTKGIYNGATLVSPVAQTVAGNSWVNFEAGGKLIASVQPNNQDMGTTQVQAYIHTGAVRNNSSQYYHNRNITIKPATNVADSVTVRFYFLDSETEDLINATGCTACSKPTSVAGLGVSKYSDANNNAENGTLTDNNNGAWLFINRTSVAKVPFDRGYYAEFKVKDFSEFWLNNGGMNRVTPLPLSLLNFTVQKAPDNSVVLKWTTAMEENVSRFEVEMAQNNTDLQNNQFAAIGTVMANGGNVQQQYLYTDKNTFRKGVYYYRLKMIDKDGAYRYSPVRSVLFTNVFSWQVYPNPSDGMFYFVYQATAGEQLKAYVSDAAGRTIKEFSFTADGFIQKVPVSLKDVVTGAYLLTVTGHGTSKTYKLYKQ